ncbi:hypothetical protein B0H10DRAFT_2161840 [Mycena sp. CBHHK59/15]|nr:hypothetical protein B0H10DRAFT_2161840 [Mycena sp. CBHHK59/15]
MFSQDSILFDSSSDGSRLLSESPFLPSESNSSSHTGPGGDDLSISELSLSHRTIQAGALPQRRTLYGDTNEHVSGGDTYDAVASRDPEELEKVKRHTSKLRDEKLQNDAFILKKLNASLVSFHDALGDVEVRNALVAAQVEQTDALLNKYISILSGSEEFARLIFDEHWQGAEADELIVAQEQREAAERARQIKAERAAAAQREQERLEREERERIDQKEREQSEKERKERAIRGGIRGVRGTRASMRATRGTSRGANPSGRPPNTSSSSASSSVPRGAHGLPRRTS